MDDYFGDEEFEPKYPEENFRRRYRANTDLNVLYGSPLFDDELADTAPECPFVVNGHTYRKGYYLADGIYLAWSTFVKSFSVARDEKSLKFKRVQEAARKYIERAFGQMWCRSVSGVVLHFADVATLFKNGTTAPKLLTGAVQFSVFVDHGALWLSSVALRTSRTRMLTV
ncbi:reverse transcriptase domain-containing protein [Tanacetum coccineum]